MFCTVVDPVLCVLWNMILRCSWQAAFFDLDNAFGDVFALDLFVLKSYIFKASSYVDEYVESTALFSPLYEWYLY